MNSPDQSGNSIVIRIDVAKQTLDFATPDISGTVPNTSDGIEKLRRKLPEPGQAVIVQESHDSCYRPFPAETGDKNASRRWADPVTT